MNPGVLRIVWGYGVSALGPLALVIYRDRSYEYALHRDVSAVAGYRTAQVPHTHLGTR